LHEHARLPQFSISWHNIADIACRWCEYRNGRERAARATAPYRPPPPVQNISVSPCTDLRDPVQRLVGGDSELYLLVNT